MLRLRFSRDWLRRKIASDPDIECEAGPSIGGTVPRYSPSFAMPDGTTFGDFMRKSEVNSKGTDPMTTKVTVSVNGNYKMPVKQADKVTWVSGRDNPGPKVVDFWPNDHGDGSVFIIGPEEPDNG